VSMMHALRILRLYFGLVFALVFLLVKQTDPDFIMPTILAACICVPK
jgi:hypothetical protein